MPIPPPPPGPPPPPAPPAFELKSPPLGGASDPNGRNMLLQSIRQGTKLKKTTVVNDRSSPLVSGGANKNNGRSPVGGNSTGSSSGGFGGGSRPPMPGGPLGLGDLFAGGMPKLKPVGSSGTRGKGFSTSSSSLNRTERQQESVSLGQNHNSSYHQESNSINSYSSSTNSLNISGTNSPASVHMSFSNKPAPPPPPPSNLKPSLTNKSSSQDHGTVVERKPLNYGKPSVAPKPPGINGGVKSTKPNPPPKLPSLYIPPPPPLPAGDVVDSGSGEQQIPSTPPSSGGSSVNRAQSMRMTRTASPGTPNSASIEYRTMGRSAGREFAAMNASGQPPPPPRMIANGVTRVRMSPLRPPSARPPPPPSNKAPPTAPPPPPPTSAPPPPRHRVSPAPTPPQVRVNGALGPLPPVPTGGPPPPPPTRNSSMRSVNSATSITSASSGSGSSSPSIYTGVVDLESRFGHLFPPLEELPSPGVFMGMVKTYPSKNAHSIKRQPAPQPPTQLTQMQLGSKMWANNTSTC